MKMHAEVSGGYRNSRTAKTVARALEPDNLKLFIGLAVSTRATGNRVVTTIELDGRMETLLATLDDLLACTITAESLL